MEKILIVDDNPKNIQVLGNILSEKDYDVEYAQNGLEAINLVKYEDFDLILMDIMMPKMDGYQACIKIKEIKTKSEIPLIFLTAKTDAQSITYGFEVGAVDYVTKPFNTPELLKRVQTHLLIKKNADYLKNINEVLELKVKEKTIELQDSVVQLEKANEELEELDTLKSQFLNIISHELRTPLNGIKGFTELLKNEDLSERGRRLFNLFNMSYGRLESFAFRAIDISELKAKKPDTLNKEAVISKAVIHPILVNVEDKLSNKDIKLETDIDPQQVFVDVYYYSQALQLLIENAIKHSPEGSKIYIRCQKVDGKYSIIIEDSGPGFPEGIIKNGIKPFGTNIHVDNNPGLDLYFCKLLARAHNGDIYITNNKGKGGVVDLRIDV